MYTNRYCFSNIIEDDDLSLMAVRAKELMQQNDKIMKIFQVNNEMLYGDSPRQVLFLMKQNNKSIFSSSIESSPSDAESYERQPTAFRHNLDTSGMQKRYLPLEETEKNVYNFATLELVSPIKSQRAITEPKIQENLNLINDENYTSNALFVSQVSSTEGTEAVSKESPHSFKSVKMTANTTIAEKEFKSTSKVVGIIDEKSLEPPCSAKVSVITTSLTMLQEEFKSPVKEVGNNMQGNQEFPPSAEIVKMTSFHTLHDEESKKLIPDVRMAGNSAISTDSSNSEEKFDESENHDLSNKYFVSHAEGMKTLNPSIISCETPSPIKIAKICSISSFDFEEISNPAEKVIFADNPPEGIKATASPLQDDKLYLSPNGETVKGSDIDDKKRKYISPRKRSSVLFSSIPRVVQSSEEEEIDIEVIDLEYDVSPICSQNKLVYDRSDSVKDCITSPSVCETKPDVSPKTLVEFLHPSVRTISVDSSRNVSGSIPGSCDYAFAEKYPSDSPSIVAMDRPCEFASSSIHIEIDPVSVTRTILRFNTLLALRDEVVKKSFVSFQSFQRGIDSITPYVCNVADIMRKLHASGKYSINELNETVNHANIISLKLIKKFRAWKKDIDEDSLTWQKCFQQIEQLQAQYEPLLTNDGKPAVPCEVVQVYESEMKAVWKKMDDMIMLGDSRRALFSHMSHDVESLIKMLVKCLILVGILQPR